MDILNNYLSNNKKVTKNYCEHDIEIDDVSGEHLCIKCGEIMEENVYDNNEYKSKITGISRVSVQTNKRLNSIQSGVKIGKNNRSVNNIISLYSEISPQERSYSRKLKKFNNICFSNNEYLIPKSVYENSISIFNKIEDYLNDKNENKIYRSKNSKAFLAGCIFFGYKKQSEYIDQKTLSKKLGIESSIITRGYKMISEIIYKIDNNVEFLNSPKNENESFLYIKQKQSIFDFNNKELDKCLELLETLRILDISENLKKSTLSTIVVYIIFKENYQKFKFKYKNNNTLSKCFKDKNFNNKSFFQVLSNIFKISPITLSKNIKKIDDYTKFLCDKKRVDKFIEKNNIKRNIDYSNLSKIVFDLNKKYSI